VGRLVLSVLMFGGMLLNVERARAIVCKARVLDAGHVVMSPHRAGFIEDALPHWMERLRTLSLWPKDRNWRALLI
jgi:hypothetical protein